MKVTVSIEIDSDYLTNFTDRHLAALWHVTQANPADIRDRDAGSIAEYVGREIIRRFVQEVGPELWSHQGRHADSVALSDLKAAQNATEASQSEGFSHV